MVDSPTVLFGKTQSGKTYRAFHLWALHPGPAIYADIQWRSYLPGTHLARSLEEVVAVLANTPTPALASGPKICWQLDDYNQLGELVNYLLSVHRRWHVENRDLPTLALFLDEIWRVANRGADANNPAVRVFTEGYQHRIVGIGLSQWPSQTSLLIGQNAYEWYLFHLGNKLQAILEQDYRMEVPNWGWVAPKSYHYWRYDGADWWKGNAEGLEVAEAAVPGVPEEGEHPADAAGGDPGRPEPEVPRGGVAVPQLQGYEKRPGDTENESG